MIKKIILSSLLVTSLSIMSTHQAEREPLALTTITHKDLSFYKLDQAQQLLQERLVQNNITPDQQAEIKLLLAQIYFSQTQRYIAEVQQNKQDQPKAQFCWLQLLFQLNPMSLAESFVKSIESLAKQSSDPKTSAKTKLLLAKTYAEKNDTETDYTMRELYQEVADQNSDPQAKACAQFCLAGLYECRRGGEKNIKKSLNLYEQAANQDANPEARIKAQYKLGEKYLGIERKDPNRAKEYFQEVAQQKINPMLQRKAQEKLKAMGLAEE